MSFLCRKYVNLKKKLIFFSNTNYNNINLEYKLNYSENILRIRTAQFSVPNDIPAKKQLDKRSYQLIPTTELSYIPIFTE